MRGILSLLLPLALLLAAPAARAGSVRSRQSGSGLRRAPGHGRADARRDCTGPASRSPGWDRGGADPDADLRAAGADAPLFQAAAGTAASASAYCRRRGRSPPSRRPAGGWSTLTARRRRRSTTRRSGSRRSRTATSSASRQRATGAATPTASSKVTNATLYEMPEGAGAARRTHMIPLMFRLLLLAAEGQTDLHPLWRAMPASRLSRPAPSCPTAAPLPALNDDPRSRSRSSRRRRSRLWLVYLRAAGGAQG